MKYRKLGNSDLQVSEIALGSWLTYSGGVETRQAIACVRRALDLGITLIDTANVYGRGAAETLMGEALQGVPRDRYVLATKLFFPKSETDKGLSRAQIHHQLGDSLNRLRTDYVDLYQCHRYDPNTPLEETMTALTEVVRAGKVRWIGFSEWPAKKICAALAQPNVAQFVSSQPQYSLLWRQPEHEIFPLCRTTVFHRSSGRHWPRGCLPGSIAQARCLRPEHEPAARPWVRFFAKDGWSHRSLGRWNTSARSPSPLA